MGLSDDSTDSDNFSLCINNSPLNNSPLNNSPLNNSPLNNYLLTNSYVTNSPLTTSYLTNYLLTNSHLTNSYDDNCSILLVPETENNYMYENFENNKVENKVKNKVKISDKWNCYVCLESFDENPAISCIVCNEGKICQSCSTIFLNNNTSCGICRTSLENNLDYKLLQGQDETIISEVVLFQNNNHEPIEYRRYVSVITKIISHSSIIFINIIFNLMIFMKYLIECENNSSILISNIIVNNILFSSSNIAYYLVSKYYFNNTTFYIKMLLFHIVFSNLYFVIYYYIIHKINCSIIHSKDILISYLETEILKLLYLFFYCIFS